MVAAWTALDENITHISRAVADGERLLLCCEEALDKEHTASYAASMKADGSAFERLPLAVPEQERLLDLAPAAGEGLWALCELPREDGGSYTLRRFDAAGDELASLALDELLAHEDALLPYADMSLRSDGAGRLCLTVGAGKASCFFFDADGGFCFFLQNEGSPRGMIQTGDGQLALCVRVGMDFYLLGVDWTRQSWGAKRALGTVSALYDGGGGTSAFLYDSADLYALASDGAEREKLFSWAELGLSSGDSHVIFLGEERFGVLTSSFSQTLMSSYEYCVVQPGVDRRTTLHMLSLQPDYSVTDAVAHFNRANTDYRVELRAVFPAEENVSDSAWNEALLKLHTEMIAGKIPDIIDLNHLSADAYLRRGLLEDLRPWLESDGAIRREDYFDRVFDALSVDGKLPYVTSSVMVLTMLADADAIGDASAWTLQDFARIKAENSQAVESVSASWFLMNLLRADNPFVDWESGICRFDSPDFVRLLELAKSAQSGAQSDYFELSDEAEYFFVNASSVFDIARYRAHLHGRARAIGYPGTGEAVHILYPANRIGISAAGEHKDGAWAFARSFLEPKQQESGGFFPIRKASFERLAQAASAGNSMWAGQLYTGQLCEEDIDLSRAILNSAAYCLDSTDGLSELISSGAEAFFSGEKSAAETAAEIQQRAALYVSENR